MAQKTSIAFGMVYIPIKLHLSVKDNDIGFNMLDKQTKSRIKYAKTCVDCNGREVKQDDIIKGYQYEKDKYVIFTDDDFEKIKTKADKSITIESFVNIDEIDPIYFSKAYYAEPIGAERAFNLLVQAMTEEGKAGIAKTVFGTKETLVAMRATGGNLIINTLHFYEEVQKPSFNIPKSKIDEKELKLAKLIIEGLMEEFSPDKYTDNYAKRLQSAIEAKIAGKEIAVAKDTPSTDTAKDLMEALMGTLNNIEPEKPQKKKATTTTAKMKANNYTNV